MEVKFIDVQYKDIFEKLNIEIKSEQVTSIIGKNGSGKTTLLNLIFGLDTNFTGKIVIGRKSITNKIKNKDLDIIRKNIFYLNQDYQNQLFNINVLEDIKFANSTIRGSKIHELLKDFDLAPQILNKNYFELSNGEIKKILLIIMLIKKSKIILLDDPTSGLDQKSISNLIKLIKKEKRNGKLIIIASQDVEFLLSVSDDIIIIDGGKIVKKDNKYEVFSNQTLLNKCALKMPNIIEFRENVLKRKKVKLMYRDNINDLMKDIYRNVK